MSLARLTKVSSTRPAMMPMRRGQILDEVVVASGAARWERGARCGVLPATWRTLRGGGGSWVPGRRGRGGGGRVHTPPRRLDLVSACSLPPNAPPISSPVRADQRVVCWCASCPPERNTGSPKPRAARTALLHRCHTLDCGGNNVAVQDSELVNQLSEFSDQRRRKIGSTC